MEPNTAEPTVETTTRYGSRSGASIVGRRREGLRVTTDERATPVSKRVVDTLLAAVGLLLSAPLWPLLAAAIKLEDGGPVFFSQERVGKGGELFRSWKFRSMAPQRENGDAPLQAELEEHRITRVGRLMRATALDELPQLWNILRGDMSLVGPRALMPEEQEARNGGELVRLEELPGYDRRHSVRPGLTGLAQVHAARDLPHRQKFRYDLLYVERRSLWLDVKLVALSLGISVTGSWKDNGRA